MTEHLTRGASATGLATLAGDRVLDAYYPEPRLGAWGTSGTTTTGQGAPDEARRVRVGPAEPSIGSLADPPADAYDAYLRLHMLSHRLIRPHQANLEGLFGVLNNVAWTSHGPVDPGALPAVQRRFHRGGGGFPGFPGGKFPPVTDFRVPSRGRVAG